LYGESIDFLQPDPEPSAEHGDDVNPIAMDAAASPDHIVSNIAIVPTLSQNVESQLSANEVFPVSSGTLYASPYASMASSTPASNGSQPSIPAAPLVNPAKAKALTCSSCPALGPFTCQRDFNRHTNRHTKPFRCQAANCSHQTATKRDLNRHHKARHGIVPANEPQYRYYCSVVGCKLGRGSEGFQARGDNAKRHIDKLHPEHSEPPIRIQTN